MKWDCSLNPIREEINIKNIFPCKILAQSKEERQAYMKEYNKKYAQDHKDEIAEKTKERASRPENKLRRKERRQKPENKLKEKQYSKEYSSRPEVKERVRKYNSTPERKTKHDEYYHSVKGTATRKKYEQTSKVKEAKKEYSSRPEVKEKAKEYQHTPKRKEYRKEYKKKPHVKSKAKNLYDDKRLLILQTYSKLHSNSNIPCCNCCGENSHVDFLALDHILGRKEMESIPELMELGYSSEFHPAQLTDWIIKNNFPEGFQILCVNCNFAKGMKKNNNQCPHEIMRKEETFARMEEQSSFEAGF